MFFPSWTTSEQVGYVGRRDSSIGNIDLTHTVVSQLFALSFFLPTARTLNPANPDPPIDPPDCRLLKAKKKKTIMAATFPPLSAMP